MKKLLMILLVGITCIAVSTSVRAATPEQIEPAIEKGIAWLATQQQPDGSWAYGDMVRDVSTTGLILVKLCDRAYELDLDPFDNNPASPTYFPYADNVIKGFDYLLGNANFDAVGISSFSGVYSTGISMMAVGASNVPDRIVTAGPLSGQTYKQVLQGMMDWMADAQNDSDCGIGGWGYTANQQPPEEPWADNSNSGYATIGIGFAGTPSYKFQIPVPLSVFTGLDTFIANVQVTSGPYGGGSLYNPCYPPGEEYVNILKTGNLLYEMAITGIPENDPRVLSAVGFIENYWNSPGCACDGGGWIGDYQAMFLLKKGFAAYDPVNDPAPSFKIITVGGNPVDWFDVVSTYIVEHQNPAGFWGDNIVDEYANPNINTAWALLTLEPTVIPIIIKREISVSVDIKPGSCPNPIGNADNNGVVPFAIMGTVDNPEFDITQIDPESIRITREGVAGEVKPIRWNYSDVATPFAGELCDCHTLMGDGYMDLSMKAYRNDLVNILKLKEVAGQTVELTITGKLKDEFGGTPIKGKDCMRVLKAVLKN